MPRYRLTIEYDGSPYNGFQAQAGQPTVQGAIETAIKGFCGQDVRIAAAGRTDSGVHATGQVVHVDLDRDWPAATVMNALNAHMVKEAVSVLDSVSVADDWHARFSCLGRSYLYRIANRRAPLTLDRGRAWQVAQPLDEAAMHRAAQALVGRHDFTTFRSVQCQAADPVKTLDRLSVERVGEEVHIRAEARSFLHHQVRSMVGCLALVGMGRWPEDRMAQALAARDRQALGLNAPSEGLYFVRALYPGH